MSIKVKLILILVGLIILSTSALGQTTAKDWWQKAFDLWNSGKYKESLEAANESIKLDPDYASAWNIKSGALFGLGKYNESVEAANRSINLNPTWSKPWASKAYAFSALGKQEESDAALAKARALGYTGPAPTALTSPSVGQTTAQDWWRKAFDLANAGKYIESLEAANESIKLDPEYAQAWNIKSYALLQLGRYNESVEAANRSIDLNPTWDHPWLNKANALSALGKYEESNAALAEARALGYTGPSPSSTMQTVAPQTEMTAENWCKKAANLGKAGKYKESLEAANESIKLDPNYAPAWNIKSYALLGLGKYNESLAAANRSIELDQSFFRPWVNKAKALSALGKYEESNAALAEARELGYTGPAPSPTIEAVAPQETIKVMTYNIFNGAGVDPTFEKWAADHGYPGNRLSKVLEIIKTADPDILGIQEAAGWDKGDPIIIEQVAQELGMKYLLGRCIYPESGYNHVAILTKFDIKDAEDYPTNFRNAALRSEVVAPNGRSIQIFVVHFIPPSLSDELKPAHLKNVPSNEIYDREISFLIEKMMPYSNGSIILMGDMNKPPSQLETVLQRANLSLGVAGQKALIDSIWISPALIFNGSMIFPYNLTQGASDHTPVVAEIVIRS